MANTINIKKMNEGCANGFQFDAYHYCLGYKEKNVFKNIKIGEGKILRVTIWWTDEFVKQKNDFGQSFNVRTGHVVPEIHFAVWENNVSHGLGYTQVIGTPANRRTFKALQTLTKDFTDEECLELFKHLKETKVNMFA